MPLEGLLDPGQRFVLIAHPNIRRCENCWIGFGRFTAAMRASANSSIASRPSRDGALYPPPQNRAGARMALLLSSIFDQARTQMS
jgi:hypothetical protein